MKVLSCFDGMSCGQIAFERAGIPIEKYYASEIDKYAIQVTMSNYPDTIQLGSITEWQSWGIEQPDIIIGGSPCQGFSFAGKQLNFKDERSKLFFTFVEILKYYKPKYFLLENVIMKKEYNDVISGILGEIYPECVHQSELFRTGRLEPIQINSALVSAQNRNRLYWTNIPGIEQPKDKNIFLKDIIENYDGKSEIISATIGNSKKFYSEQNSGKSYCLIKNHCFGIKINNEYRLFSPIEAERLQTVKEGYTDFVSKGRRYEMLGNGWTVDVIAHIFSFLKEQTI